MNRALLLAASAALGLLSSGGAFADGQKDAKSQAVVRGSVVYQKYCAVCHGPAADGHGRAAKLHTPPPVDLTRSTVNNQYRELIIRGGSQAVGRSDGMPPWKDELTEAEIQDVISFLAAISKAR